MVDGEKKLCIFLEMGYKSTLRLMMFYKFCKLSFLNFYKKKSVICIRIFLAVIFRIWQPFLGIWQPGNTDPQKIVGYRYFMALKRDIQSQKGIDTVCTPKYFGISMDLYSGSCYIKGSLRDASQETNKRYLAKYDCFRLGFCIFLTTFISLK